MSVVIEGVSVVIEGVSIVIEGVSSFPVDFLSTKKGLKIPMQNVDALLNTFGVVLESMTLMLTLYCLPFQHRKALNLPIGWMQLESKFLSMTVESCNFVLENNFLNVVLFIAFTSAPVSIFMAIF